MKTKEKVIKQTKKKQDEIRTTKREQKRKRKEAVKGVRRQSGFRLIGDVFSRKS